MGGNDECGGSFLKTEKNIQDLDVMKVLPDERNFRL
jgi:hypothetical protein